MSKKDDALYAFSMTEALVTPLNADLTEPAADNIIGGIGPFDFSGVADISAVPFKSKIDGGAIETVTVDLSAAADQSAVTVDELFAAINVSTPTDITAAKDGTTGRLTLTYGGSGSVVQIWGNAATIAEIGQGVGVRIAYSNTMQSVTDTPTLKDQETITVTDSNGVDTEVIADGYRKGTSGTLTDTAVDYLMRAIVEGGTYDEDEGTYDVPTSLSDTIYFKLETYGALYQVGTSKEADVVKYLKTEVFSCSGTFGDRTRERGWTNSVYNYTATTTRDENGNVTPDSKETVLTVSEYEALSLEDLATA
jgi:hypothetical protein